MIVCCPRCGGPVRGPNLSASVWRCLTCGPVPPMHLPPHIGAEVLDSVIERVGEGPDRAPLWCPWPLPRGWTVTGTGWVGDPAGDVVATAVTCTGPSPLHAGPADMVLIAEEPGVGLGNRLAGLHGSDPSVVIGLPAGPVAPVRVRASGRDTPMWTVGDTPDRVSYVGEARGRWLYVVALPADAGYLLSEPVSLHDLCDGVPPELVYGAPSMVLHGRTI